ncbi:MAG: hypothetical protein KDA24_18670 [Deltaproteobacteria bacterium]|nr:hypothetical protein [Deltaproteobacteria bacterium]
MSHTWPQRAAQSEAHHVAWLTDGPTRDDDGGVWSWANAGGRGFPYLEAAGLLLSLHCEALVREGPDPAIHADGARIVQWILPRLDGGVVEHKGARYAFDTAIVVASLDRWVAASDDDSLAVRGAVAGGRRFLATCVEQQVGQRGHPKDGHWSREFGPHLLKLAVAMEHPCLDGLANHFLRTCWDGERFHIHADSQSWYAHAHAYALEGLLALRARGHSIDMSVVDAGLDTLRRTVSESGTSTDVAAQLIRLGLLRGWSAEDEGLNGAWERVASRARVDGGVLYRDDSPDVNTWATVFTVQAHRWSRIGADPSWLA